MKTFIYTLQLVERLWDPSNWTKEVEDIIHEHFMRIQHDYQQGIIVHVGKTLVDGKNGFGIVIFNASNDIEAEDYMNHDPAILKGLMTGKCVAYKIVFGS